MHETPAQDRGTSAVWGMPQAALNSGAAQRALPIEEVAPALVEVERPVVG